MNAITSKQTSFCRQVALGSSLSHAYREAYSATNMLANTVHKEAHKLMQNPKVTTMVDALQKQANAEVIRLSVASREEVLATLTECMQSGEPKDSVRLKAAETLGKHYGLFTDRLAIEKPERSSEEVKNILQAKLTTLIISG
jgi:phage terminase small subunit